MPQFTVKAREIHTASYTVIADSADEAVLKLQDCRGEGEDVHYIDDSGELDCLVDPTMWEVTDENGNVAWNTELLCEATAKALLERLNIETDTMHYDSLIDTLDELVQDLASHEASSWNNEGIEGQLAFILNAVGPKLFQKTLLQHLKPFEAVISIQV